MPQSNLSVEQHCDLINRVIDFIEHNLNEELSLDQIARFAGLSDSHFHKIFTRSMKETPGHFIQRLRIERAASLLVQHPTRSVTDIAYSCGFSSSASFTRTFREYFTVTPSGWRDPDVRNSVKTKRYAYLLREMKTDNKQIRIDARYIGSSSQLGWTVYRDGRVFSQIAIEHFRETQIAYVRHIGPYMMNQQLFRSLYMRLYTWAVPRKLVNAGSKLFNIYHDDPFITGHDRLRLSIGIEVPSGTETGGDISSMILEEGDYAAASFEIDPDDYLGAWSLMFSDWFPQSGYACKEGLSFEIPLQDPGEHPEGKHCIKIYIPVMPRQDLSYKIRSGNNDNQRHVRGDCRYK